MKLLILLVLSSLIILTIQIKSNLDRKTKSHALTFPTTIAADLKKILQDTEIQVLRYNAKIPATNLPNGKATLAEVLNKVKEDDKLKKTINLAYSTFCTVRSQGNGFRWEEVKTAATLSGEPDIFMIPFLRFREVSNVLVLAMATEKTYFAPNFLATNCPSKTALPTQIVETAQKSAQLLSQNLQIPALCANNPTDFFVAASTAYFNTNANLKIEMPEGNIKIFDNNDHIITAMAAGSVTTFSDIDQTISSPTIQNAQQFLFNQCLQAEIVRGFDSLFAGFFENTSFDTFDLNAYVNGFFELEVKHKDFTKANCETRKSANNYINLNNMVSLFGLNNLLHHIHGSSEESNLQHELQQIINYNKEKEGRTTDYMFYASINIEDANYMKEDIQRVLGVQANQAAALFPRLADAFAQKSNEQKIIYLRNIAYYMYIKEANKDFQDMIIKNPQANGVALENYLGNLAYNNKEYIKKVLKSVFYTNEAVFTGGSLMHVLGGQLKKKAAFADYVWSFMNFDVVQSFYLNIGFALDHFLHFYYEFIEETDASKKKYFLWEGMLKLAKYSNRAFEALDFSYFTQCPNNAAATLRAAHNIPAEELTAFRTFVGQVLELKENKDNRKTLLQCMNDLETKYQAYIQQLNLQNDAKKAIKFMVTVFQSILQFMTRYNIGGMAKDPNARFGKKQKLKKN